MGADTKIEWADHTWNPWYGCTPVSEGCENCYALRRMTQLKRVSGPGDLRQASEAVRRFPLSKKVKAGDRVFVCSWSDFFHEDIPNGWRSAALDMMVERRDVTFLLLTKRPTEMERWVLDVRNEYKLSCAIKANLAHIWLGFTAENQKRFDERWPIMEKIEWPGKKFVSLEPMLGPIVLPAGFELHKASIDVQTMRALEDSRRVLDWIIAGGETGPNARPMHPEWLRSLRDQCVEAGVPFFFKGWGEWAPEAAAHKADAVASENEESPSQCCPYGEFHMDGEWIDSCLCEEGEESMWRLGKKKAGRILDGRTWEELPG